MSRTLYSEGKTLTEVTNYRDTVAVIYNLWEDIKVLEEQISELITCSPYVSQTLPPNKGKIKQEAIRKLREKLKLPMNQCVNLHDAFVILSKAYK